CRGDSPRISNGRPIEPKVTLPFMQKCGDMEPIGCFPLAKVAKVLTEARSKGLSFHFSHVYQIRNRVMICDFGSHHEGIDALFVLRNLAGIGGTKLYWFPSKRHPQLAGVPMTGRK